MNKRTTGQRLQIRQKDVKLIKNKSRVERVKIQQQEMGCQSQEQKFINV